MQNTIFKGIVAKGLGQGIFFMSMPHYKKEIKKKLGFDAYPGTLNLKTNKSAIGLINSLLPIKIKGFKSSGKIYGAAKCYRAKINDVNGAIIIPDLTKHKNVIEFIAPIHLKSKLKIKEGDKVNIELLEWQK